MIDRYQVTGRQLSAILSFDEDSYCTSADPPLAEFLTLDFEWFREHCRRRNWTFKKLAGLVADSR